MLDQKPLEKIIFLDIETTSLKEKFADLTDRQKEIIKKRFKKHIAEELALKIATKTTKKVDSEILMNETLEEVYDEKAPIVPEFGRILCISMGVLWRKDKNTFNIKINTFADHDEKKLLTDMVEHPKLGPILKSLPSKYEKEPEKFWALCAHNGKLFDFVFIAKRLIINGIKPPAMFDYAHFKPWEISGFLIDTRSEWSFGVFDSAVGLDCLGDIFGIESSKDDMDGSEVKSVYYKEGDLDRISKYCGKDVLALARICLKMKSMKEDVVLFEEPKKPDQKEPENINETIQTAKI